LSRGDDEEWPNADTKDFTAVERLKAKRIAEILSEQISLRRELGFLTLNAFKYGFVKEWGTLLLRKIGRRLLRSS
jgi:hypothetical protein